MFQKPAVWFFGVIYGEYSKYFKMQTHKGILVFQMEKHRWINLPTNLPYIITSEVKRLFAWLFFPWNMRMACAQKSKPDFTYRGGRTVEELYPCEWRWQWRAVTFMTPAKDWELGKLRRTITENKSTSKKLSLSKNLPVRETKTKNPGHCPSGGCCVTISH